LSPVPPPPRPVRSTRTLCLLVLALFAAAAHADAPSFPWRKLPNRAFKVGETVRYSLKYGVVLAGRATLEVKGIESFDGRPAYHIVSQAKTNKTLDKAYKVRDSNDSWMDADSLCSVQFMQNIREGGYRKWTLTRLDQARGRFDYQKKGKTKDDFASGDLPAFAQDPLSCLYYLRTLDLKVGEESRADANSGGSTWPLRVLVKGIETVTVPAGTFECLRVEPVLSGEGIFLNKGKLEVWMTNDKRKIPVLLRSEVAVGAFTAEMTEYSVLGRKQPALDEDED
jgi:hypothetical protein